MINLIGLTIAAGWFGFKPAVEFLKEHFVTYAGLLGGSVGTLSWYRSKVLKTKLENGVTDTGVDIPEEEFED